jgi:hypothetical protein
MSLEEFTLTERTAKGQQAMALALIYPDAEKGGRRRLYGIRNVLIKW